MQSLQTIVCLFHRCLRQITCAAMHVLRSVILKPTVSTGCWDTGLPQQQPLPSKMQILAAFLRPSKIIVSKSFHEAKSFQRSYKFIRYSRNSSSHFIESKDSLPNSQKPTTNGHPEPDQSIPTLLSYFFKIYFNIILPSMSRSTNLPTEDKFIFTFQYFLIFSERVSWKFSKDCHVSVLSSVRHKTTNTYSYLKKT